MAGRIKADDVALVKERSSIEDVVREHVTLRSAGPRLDEGPLPLPRREEPVLQRPPGRRRLALLRLRRGRRRHLLPPEDRPPHLRRGGRAAGRQARHGAALRGRRRPPARGAAWAGRARLIEAHRVAAEFYADAAGQPAATPGPAATSCASAASTVPRPRTLRRRVRPARRRGADRPPARQGVQRRRDRRPAAWPAAGQRGLYDRFRGRLVWPIRDITGDVVGLRRAPPLRRRPDRGQVPQHLRDADLQEVQRPLRPRPGQEARSRATGRRWWSRATPTSWPATSPASRPPSPRAARRSASTTSRRCAGSCATRATPRRPRWCSPSTATRPGRRPPMRAFGEDQRWASQSFVAVEASGHGPVRAAPVRGRRGGPRPRRGRRADVRVRRPHHDQPVRPRHRRGPGPGPAGGRADRRRHPRPQPAPGVHPRPWPGWLGLEVEQVATEVHRAGRRPGRRAGPAGPGPGAPARTTATAARARGQHGQGREPRTPRATRCRDPTCATPSCSPSASCCRRCCSSRRRSTRGSTTASSRRRSRPRPTGPSTTRSRPPGGCRPRQRPPCGPTRSPRRRPPRSGRWSASWRWRPCRHASTRRPACPTRATSTSC